MPHATPEAISAFITRWENSGAAERANYQMFLAELCAILGVPRPDPTSPDPSKNLYVFDRAITRAHLDGSATTNYIDLYKARHFICETKQGLSAPASPVANRPMTSPSIRWENDAWQPFEEPLTGRKACEPVRLDQCLQFCS